MSLWLHMVRLELVRALREGNTLLYLGFPLLAYPMMVWGSVQAITWVKDLQDRETLEIAVHGPLASLDALGEPPLAVVEGTLEDLDAGRVELVVEGDRSRPVLHYRSGAGRSKRARALVEQRLEAHAGERMLADVQEAGGDPAAVEPLVLEAEASDSSDAVMRWLLGVLACSMVPATLALGVLSPVSELFVAERERSSLETTLTAAVSRQMIASARLVAATLLGTAAGVGNLLALTLTVVHSALLVDMAEAVVLPPLAAFVASGALVASSALLITTVFAFAFSVAQSFREAQAIASPVLMVLIGPSLAGTLALVGGWTADVWWVPLLHTGTLLASSIDGTAAVGHVVGAVAIDLLLVAALWGAWSATFGAEALIAGLARPAWVGRLFGGTA